MNKVLLCSLLLCVFLPSCKYQPYIKYYRVSKSSHLPHFNKWDKLVGSNTTSLRSSYNVTCYDWTVRVVPEKKRIDGLMKIYFQMVASEDSIMLDLERHMKIDQVKCNIPLKKWRRKKDAVFFVFDKALLKNEQVVLEINYHGTPVKIASFSSIYWKKDKNNKPWIATSTQGIGPHHMMPCKILLSDEADSCFIRIESPEGLMAVANGKLLERTGNGAKNVYHWAVKNPINIYNISFNIGDFVKLEKEYLDLNGVSRTIDVYPISYNKTIADTFYDQVPLVMKNYETLFGAYPWWNDGCKFIETSRVGWAMEHQSGISMPQGFYHYDHKRINTVLVHELAHEWWGNSVTGYDYADFWLHEGFATYCEALTAEVIYGKKDYGNFIRYFAMVPKNRRPVLKQKDVLYNSLVHKDDQDVYYKGALLLHTLRRQLDNDDQFFKILKNFQADFRKSNVTTSQFISYFNAEAHRDFTPYFNVYLKQATPPCLDFSVSQVDSTKSLMRYKWRHKLPDNFSMKVTVDFKDTLLSIYPSSEWQQIQIPANQPVIFDRAKFGYIIPEKVKP